MAEKIPPLIDPVAVVEQVKPLLLEASLLPVNCPNHDCLYFQRATLTMDGLIVEIRATPPQLPTTMPGVRKYDLHPVCEYKCGIGGNPNCQFEARQNPETQKITVKADWVSRTIFI